LNSSSETKAQKEDKDQPGQMFCWHHRYKLSDYKLWDKVWNRFCDNCWDQVGSLFTNRSTAMESSWTFL